MQKHPLFFLVFIVFLGLACNTTKKAKDKEEAAVEAPEPYAPTLHDIWVLETLDGQLVDRSKPRPLLELYPGENRISGTGGCNDFFGQMTAKGWDISFQNIGTTKIFCQELMDTEHRFLKQLAMVNSYQIKDLKLILMMDKEAKLILKKVD